MQKKRSAVWRHFQETEGNKVTCRACHKRLTKHGNTSMMLRHLRGKHPELMTSFVDAELAALGDIPSSWQVEEQLADDLSETIPTFEVTSENSKQKKRSTVWRHFLEDGHGKVSCRICQEKLVKHGNTSSMLRHLRGKHPQLKLGELQGERNYSRLQLRATNTESRFLSVCERLLQHNHLTDVTLMAEGQFVQAHRLVLATCSDSFEELFKTVTHANPVVVLRDITMHELRGILNYMYKGETLVKSQELPGLLKAAAQLRIRGLSQVGLSDTWMDGQRDEASPQASGVGPAGASKEEMAFYSQELEELDEEDQEEDDDEPMSSEGAKKSYQLMDMCSDLGGEGESIPRIKIKIETGLGMDELDADMDELESGGNFETNPEESLEHELRVEEENELRVENNEDNNIFIPSEEEVVIHEEAIDEFANAEAADATLEEAVKGESNMLLLGIEEGESPGRLCPSDPVVEPSTSTAADTSDTIIKPASSTSNDHSRRSRTYAKQDLVTALNMVRDNHLGLKPAARAFNIPITTLLNAMKKHRASPSRKNKGGIEKKRV